MSNYKEKPCFCGFVPEKNRNEFESFGMKMGKIMGQELPLRKAWRCKTCKDVCMLVKSDADDFKEPDELDKLVDVLRLSKIPSSFSANIE
jgi:hypothetical protein